MWRWHVYLILLNVQILLTSLMPKESSEKYRSLWLHNKTYNAVIHINFHSRLNVKNMFYNNTFILPFLLKVEWPWNCERRCKSLKIDPSKNVILLSGDRMMSAQCDSITESHSGVLIWDKKVKIIFTESYKWNMRYIIELDMYIIFYS